MKHIESDCGSGCVRRMSRGVHLNSHTMRARVDSGSGVLDRGTENVVEMLGDLDTDEELIISTYFKKYSTEKMWVHRINKKVQEYS